MIMECTGNMFHADVQALVNPVNCEGVMGAGLAKEFKRQFPALFTCYKEACKRGHLKPGEILSFPFGDSCWVFNVATKDRWKEPSKYAWVASGLVRIRDRVIDGEISSICIPALGCGLGELKWNIVREMSMAILNDVACDIRLYAPLET